MRVLYVEDDRINVLLFEETLKLHGGGHELRIAEDAAQALQIAQAWRPDVLVIDAHLPDAHGIELLPAFMCSADAQPEDVAAARAAGFTGYWTKPIDIDRIGADLAALDIPARR